ncbi:hypothetical protein [Streptomyces griseomycini]|uniref:Minor tail protein n=1 Tax=Streptomyces griseomycini TaxID=66895 RepID=A0A7W7V9W7_9ACTN|nr:hypothetical protein [Streptomyces griseomycini]MBB4902503.1 hypothetical protein [Streptomyces griseomycini]GGR52084.1 hypothetical protein GCM10015536_66950 [Streptomyces griseomycini]
MPAGWRFIAQSALSEEVLDWQVPFALSSNPKRDLSGPGSMTGTIEPEYARMLGPDGQPILQEWGTKIYLEVDGSIRWGGLVTKTAYDGEQAKVSCEGFSSYPHGIPFDDYIISGQKITPKDPYAGKDKNHDGYIDFSNPKRKVPPAPKPYGGPRIDVYDAFRKIWSHVQSRPFSDVGLVIDSHDKGELLGAKDGSDPWELAWWDAPDCGQTLDNLVKQYQFDWIETHAWKDSTSNTITHRVRLGTPRLGRKRTDLRFAQGENIIAIAKPEGMGDDYANEVIVLGRGEGRKMKRVQVADFASRTWGTRRLRRVATVTDKTLTSGEALRKRGQQELNGRTAALQIPAVQIIDHPNARFGSWSLGDDIRVQVHVPWVGDIDVWHRIVSDEISADGLVTFTLKRSDSFHY